MRAFEQVLERLAPRPGLEASLRAYADQVRFYNRKLNLVARTDEEALLDHHVAHCLWLATRELPPGPVVDWGTGGGLPLIPLALAFPDTLFVGVDAVQKKTLAVQQMARSLGLSNVEVVAARAEELCLPHGSSVSRATAPLAVLWDWHLRGWEPGAATTGWPAGLTCLKGGALEAEVLEVKEAYPVEVMVTEIPLDDPYFRAKKVVTVTPR